MNSQEGEVCGWHYRTRQAVRVLWRDGVIRQVAPTETVPPPNVWLAPPLFDLQINGYAGIDFQKDDLRLEDLFTAIRQLRLAGCSRFLLTIITDDWPRMTARLRQFCAWRAQSPAVQTAIAGWHLEGPFLSAEPGFRGAHNPSYMVDPTPEHIRELREITGQDPVLLTLAPERPGAFEAIPLAVSLGMKVSLGHTNASTEVLDRAFEAGATGFTHLGNGCPQQLDRHDNILWRVLDTSKLVVSLIPDRIHISPQLFRLIHRWLGPEAIYYTTDAMSAAGAGPGRYSLGKMELEVGPDQVVRQPGQSLFAGSALRPIDGVWRAAQMLNGPWQEAWRLFSVLPARLMGLTNDLGENQLGFCLLKTDLNDQIVEIRWPTLEGSQS